MSGSHAGIRASVRGRFATIAATPEGEKKFPVGPESAKNLGYDPGSIDRLPGSVTGSFAGVGNPLCLGEIRPGETVLDLGSGAGLDCLLAAARVGSSGRVVGLDLTEEMVEKARQNATALGVRNIEFLCGEIEDLPLQDGVAHVAISNGVFNLCPDKPRALAETARARPAAEPQESMMARDERAQRFDALRVDPETIKDFFDRVGPWFYTWFFTLLGYRSSLGYFWREHFARMELREGTRILDSGIGTGFLTVSLLRKAPIPLTITGVDFSPGMLVGLKRNLEPHGFEKRVTTSRGDMRKLPFADASFDFVMTSEAMEYLPDVREGISECARVLRPGGSFLFIATKNSFMGKLIAATWKNKVLDPDHVASCMRASGIQRVDTLHFPWYFKHVDATIMALLGDKAPS